MSAENKPAHKLVRVNLEKVRRVQGLLGAADEREAIETLLDLVISEYTTNRAVLAAHIQFLKSGVKIKDVYGGVDGG